MSTKQDELDSLKAQLAQSERTLKSLISAARECEAKGEPTWHFGMVIELQDAECGHLEMKIKHLEQTFPL